MRYRVLYKLLRMVSALPGSKSVTHVVPYGGGLCAPSDGHTSNNSWACCQQVPPCTQHDVSIPPHPTARPRDSNGSGDS